MNEPLAQPPTEAPLRRPGLIALILLASAAALILAIVRFNYFHYEKRVGPAQPIPFSHRIHAQEKGISCFMCHPGTMQGSRAGVPALETCMLCHKRIIITHPEIRKLRALYDQRVPVEWVKVYELPEFVYYDHESHIRRQVDCGGCHGDVQAMDRLVPPRELTMGFCVQCHRDNKVSHDCLKCHR